MEKLLTYKKINLLPCLGCLLILTSCFVGTTANAGQYTGHIATLFVSAPNNLPFRITLDVSTPDCPLNILFVDSGNSNYQTYVSTLLLAYSLGKSITVTYTPSTTYGSYCSINEFSVN